MLKANSNDLNLENLVEETEQLSLMLTMYDKKSFSSEIYRSQVAPLILQLHSNLEDISQLILLQNHLQKVS